VLYKRFGKKYTWLVRNGGCNSEKKGVFLFRPVFIEEINQNIWVLLEAQFMMIDHNCKMLLAPEDGSSVTILGRVNKVDNSLEVVTKTYNFPF
jgi:hypothetical protein